MFRRMTRPALPAPVMDAPFQELAEESTILSTSFLAPRYSKEAVSISNEGTSNIEQSSPLEASLVSDTFAFKVHYY